MDGIVKRFMSFEKLIATSLIKVLYWVGVIGIAIGTLIAILGAFAGFGQGFAQGVGMLIIAPIGGVVSLIFWRFLCEVYIVIFGMYDRLGNIQDHLGAKENSGGAADL